MPDIRTIPMRVRVTRVAAVLVKLIVLDLATTLHGKPAMNSSAKKHSMVIGSHKTSISLEDKFWARLQQIARERAQHPYQKHISMLDAERNGGNLSSAIRVFVLNHYSKYRCLEPETAREWGRSKF